MRLVWLRYQLDNFPKRLKALEAKVAEEGLILTEAQIAALEKDREDRDAPPWLPGRAVHLLRGLHQNVGKIYQQTFIDTYTKVAQAKVYDRKNALVAADMLNDRVLPFYEQHELKLLRILTDRGTEY